MCATDVSVLTPQHRCREAVPAKMLALEGTRGAGGGTSSYVVDVDSTPSRGNGKKERCAVTGSVVGGVVPPPSISQTRAPQPAPCARLHRRELLRSARELLEWKLYLRRAAWTAAYCAR